MAYCKHIYSTLFKVKHLKLIRNQQLESFKKFHSLSNRAINSPVSDSLYNKQFLKLEKVFFKKRCLHVTNELYSEIVSFKLSDIGEGISEVTVKEWFVNVGDKVNQFDSICEVQSDKASVTITSRYDGIITKIYYDVDQIAKVGNPLVDIEVESDQAEQIDQVHDQDANKPLNDVLNIEKENFSSTSGKVLATPAVRMLAMKNNVNLNDVKGTGKDNRILKEDVLRLIEEKSNRSTSGLKVSQKSTLTEKTFDKPKSEQKPLTNIVEVKPDMPDRVEVIRGIQKAMVKTMNQALKIPHFSLCEEINITELIKVHTQVKKTAEDRDLRLSYMPFFIKAASLALSQIPIINSSVDDKCENITYKSSHNIGFAMDTKNGLVVPNIKSVQNLTLLEITSELNRLQDMGKNGKLTSQDLSNGTFTLSNIGSIGGLFGVPVILPPEVAIGAIGQARVLPRFDNDGNLHKAHIINVVWSGDHRVIDGATLCRFSNIWKNYLENPFVMLIYMK